jgi:uncharacterized protein YndB with AHSA1/START domain
MPKVTKKITIAAPVEKVWTALTHTKAIASWMGGVVKVSLKVGGEFAFFKGETTGAFTRIEKPNTLEYTWRQANWPAEWADSRVHWELNPIKSGTQVRLTHDKFPNEAESAGHDEGWDTHWLTPMKAWLEAKAA